MSDTVKYITDTGVSGSVGNNTLLTLNYNISYIDFETNETFYYVQTYGFDEFTKINDTSYYLNWTYELSKVKGWTNITNKVDYDGYNKLDKNFSYYKLDNIKSEIPLSMKNCILFSWIYSKNGGITSPIILAYKSNSLSWSLLEKRKE